MKKTVTACLALGLAAVLCPPPAAAEDPVAGVVVAVTGKPDVIRQGATKGQRLKKNKFVYEGDKVVTGPKERVAIAMVGGAEVRINENSEFVLESGGGRRAASLFTKAGQAWTRLLHGRAGLSVRTPMAVAAVRGTEADIEMERRMTVKVYEGLVDVMNSKGKQSLTAGQMSQVGGAGQAPSAAKSMGKDDFGDWHESIKGREKDYERNQERLKKEAEKYKEFELEINKGGDRKKIKLKLEKGE